MGILEQLAILAIDDWVKIKIQSQILIVSKCMLNVFRPSFELVKGGRILKEIKHLENSNIGFF